MVSGRMRNFFLSKVLRADPNTLREETEALQRIARDTIGESFLEEDPTVVEWFRSLVPTRTSALQYVRDLFPSAQWTRRYNLHWLLGDSIAGVTVGLVVVPQAMAYALLARLSPAFGLYTTFTGAVLYWIFGTSKDIVIGTTAVGSLLVGSVISNVEAAKPGVYEPQQIAHTVSFLTGLILLFLGFTRLGWLIEFIPYIPISAFVTSASITILSTQIPAALGITGINTREAPYLVLINTLKGLPTAKLDAAIGITSIILLFLIRDVCAMMEVRQPSQKRMWSLISSLRLTFTVLLYTFISWLAHRTTPKGSSKFRIVGTIEKGFSHASIPKMDTELFGLVAQELPAMVIILIVEHIAIAKSFGRIYGYTVIPSQEILAQGAANVLSPFVGGYVCTGSFGASAVLSKAGVRTPLAGLFSAMVLVLALYALTGVFYFIPHAALAGLIIHATCNLITPPKSLYKYWQLSPFELGIWVIGVVLAIFINLETSIYAGIGLSFALLLIRMARSPAKFRGQAKVTRVVRNSQVDEPVSSSSSSFTSSSTTEHTHSRHIFLPMQGKTSHNPNIKVEPPYPGVFIYRFDENFNYINQAYHIDHLLSYIFAHTRRTTLDDGIPLRDRLWSDTPPSPKQADEAAERPLLRAIVLDFSTVNVLDMTSIQGLVDMRNTLDRYAAPAVVEWHFAGVHNRWTRRALAFAGFGYPSTKNPEALGNWVAAYTVAEDERERDVKKLLVRGRDDRDEEMWRGMNTNMAPMKRNMTMGAGQVGEQPAVEVTYEKNKKKKMEPLYGVDRPFFHVDLTDAVDAAVRDAKRRDEWGSVDGRSDISDGVVPCTIEQQA